jgi:indole-3-glycerol phosphate synthase
VILDEIIKKTKYDLEEKKQKMPLEWLGRSLAYNPYQPRDAKEAIMSTPDNPYRMICEIKKASPSKGVIRADFDPLMISRDYEMGGADMFSILTEPHYFQGDIDYIPMVRRFSPVPILRKDFIVDEYQIVEALVYGADIVLLIAKALTQGELKQLLDFTRRYGLEALVEIHDKDDLTKAIFAGADIIGINHRNLETFEMDMSLSSKLIPMIPNGKIIVAESGINSHEQVLELSKIGVDAFLIGEHFMRQSDIAAEVKKLKGTM